MKSAYDLAMERLEKNSPTHKLTEEQKASIAEIESICRSKIAERELLLRVCPGSHAGRKERPAHS